MSNALVALTDKLADRFELGASGQELVDTLKATAFKVNDGMVTDAQMTALLIVANQHGLNPWTREIYAFPDKKNGIVPVVGVDGWSRIINGHQAFDGMEFSQSEEMITPSGGKLCPVWMECSIFRKDRSHPIVIREYLDEVYREAFSGEKNGRSYSIAGPWQSHTKRLLRHKTMIQAARMAFSFTGIFDEDEAQRIAETEKDITPAKPEPAVKTLPEYPAESFNANLTAWRQLVETGKKTAEQIAAMVSSKYQLTDSQRSEILSINAVIEGELA